MTWHCIENPKDSIRKLLISEYSKVAGYKIDTQKSLAFLYSNNEKSEKLQNQSHLPLQKNIYIYLEINLPKETKELYTENYKTLMKEIKDDLNSWRDIPCFWVGRINIVKMTILPNAIYRFNVIPYQITNDIFHRIRTKIFTINMETQKTPNSQSSLVKEEMELEESTFLT